MGFEIAWWVPEQSWRATERAFVEHPPGSAVDQHGLVLVDLLYGRIQMRTERSWLIPHHYLMRGYRRALHASRRGHLRREIERAHLSLKGVGFTVGCLVIDGAQQVLSNNANQMGWPQPRRIKDYAGSDCFWVSTHQEDVGISVGSCRRSGPPGAPIGSLRMAGDEYRAGLHAFVSDVTHAIEQRAPHWFDWQALAPLRSFRSRQ